MEKISFINWLEAQTTVASPTVLSPPMANPALAPTVTINHGDTVNEPQRQNISTTPDPEVTQSTNTLQQIQNQLSSIFKKVMEKPIWKNKQMQAAFGDRVTRSWEKAGQARMILAPLGDGDNTEDV